MKLFLDANVLYPQMVRSVLLACTTALGWQAFWSERVLTEWRIAVARNLGIEAEQTVLSAQADMARAFPEALVTPDPGTEQTITLPDPADAHVLAGAVAAGAGTVVTFNLRDFPRRVLSAWHVEARHPDGLLWQALSNDPDRTGVAISQAADAGGIAAGEIAAALKRARLPRLAKAWKAGHQA